MDNVFLKKLGDLLASYGMTIYAMPCGTENSRVYIWDGTEDFSIDADYLDAVKIREYLREE